MHRTAATTKNDLAQNVNCAKVDKPVPTCTTHAHHSEVLPLRVRKRVWMERGMGRGGDICFSYYSVAVAEDEAKVFILEEST